MTTELIAGLNQSQNVALDGALAGLKGAAAGVTLDMRDSPAHGDQTGASHANYSARAVGRGENGAQLLGVARAAASALNPGHVGPGSEVAIDGVGIILDDQMDYSPDREQARAGEKAVLTPAVRASGQRFTQAAASGMKRALGS